MVLIRGVEVVKVLDDDLETSPFELRSFELVSDLEEIKDIVEINVALHSLFTNALEMIKLIEICNLQNECEVFGLDDELVCVEVVQKRVERVMSESSDHDLSCVAFLHA